ncbi:hypothetical protein OSTOST_16312, partial [Ostertagia ostertagi]
MTTWLVLSSLLVVVSAFNIDTKNAVVHSAPAGGYFGYSLDFYNEEKGMPVLVVGAPESETTNPNLRGIRRPGAVYVCSVNKPTCREVHVDKKRGNEHRLNGSTLAPIEDKAYQFFGATVVSNNKHDKLLYRDCEMCAAPKYKYFFSKFEVIEPRRFMLLCLRMGLPILRNSHPADKSVSFRGLRDDIIMGCPFYTDYVTVKDAKTQERKPQYDVGKVVIFFQTAPGVFDRTSVILGEDQWGRFGFSLAAAGDLNQD